LEPVRRSVADIVAVLDGDDLGNGACSGKLPLGAVLHAEYVPEDVADEIVFVQPLHDNDDGAVPLVI
jgi:hypothetical protein